MIYFCCDENRRRALALHPTLNGIDYLEVSEDQTTLYVHFVKDLAPQDAPPEAEAVGAADEDAGPHLEAAAQFQFTPGNVIVEGGERIPDVAVTGVEAAPAGQANVLAVRVSQPGDYSTYTLRLVNDDEDHSPPDGFDPVLSSIDFSFKVACESDFDCEQERDCPPELLAEPEIDYLAKDYASFRQLMLDRMAVLSPRWRERGAADLGVALVELLAYVGDHLSYQQDAASTEAYLHTARRRVSVRRHARLVDYPVHDGANARAWVRFEVSAALELPKGTRLFTRLANLDARIEPGSTDYEHAISAGPVVFETTHAASLHAANNEIEFYTWGDERCCLPKGATRASLRLRNVRGEVSLAAGDVLVFVEVRNPANGIAEEANPSHRHAVRLTVVEGVEEEVTDPLFKETDGTGDVRVINVEWAKEDALPFPLCLWEVAEDGGAGEKRSVSVALGNIVLADHGLTVEGEPLGEVAAANPALNKITTTPREHCEESEAEPAPPRFRPRLQKAPLTHVLPVGLNDSTAPASAWLSWPVREFVPSVSLRSTLGGRVAEWEPRRDLLASGPGKTEFVVEVEADGSASARFGDDRFGARPASGTAFEATYRYGGGVAGNVGAGSLVHVVSNRPEIVGVSNPLAAQGGAEPETVEEIRRAAPSAFRTQERAVTEADYAEVAGRHSDVQRAAATFRWTGSWRTVFLTVDRLGGAEVDRAFEDEMLAHVERYRMAGHDVEVEGPIYVPLEIEMAVCVKPDYSRSDVRSELLELFSSRTLSDGRRGLFHPDALSLGEAVYLSPIYAAAQSVEGVSWVEIKAFGRQGVDGGDAVETGRLELGRLEVARLDNDPNFPERGLLRLDINGGR